jgi:hypothetical protein
MTLSRWFRRSDRAREGEILERRERRWRRPACDATLPLGEFSSRAWRGRLGDAYPGGGTFT